MLAILFYKDTANPEGIPGVWPAEVKTLRDGDPLPEAPWALMNELEYEAYMNEPSLIEAKEQWNSIKKPTTVVIQDFVAKVVVTDVCAKSGAMLNKYDTTTRRVYAIPGSVLEFRIEIQTLDGYVIEAFSDFFAMPLMGEGQPTRIIGLTFFGGIAHARVIFERGIYEVTEAGINRELPLASQMKFDGIRIYVLEMGAQ